MKIIFLIGNLKKGGAERVITTLANNFCKKGNDITIVTTTKEEIEYKLNENIVVQSLDISKPKENFILRNIVRLRKLKRIIKEEKSDVIISFLPEPSFRLMLIKSKKITTIISIRNDPKIEYKSKILKKIAQILYNRADGVVFQTIEAQNFFCNSITKKSIIIENPIKKDFLVAKPSKDRNNNIINVGRLNIQKNQKNLILAFSKILNKYPNLNLLIYGEGELHNELNNYIKELQLEKRIKLMGTIDDLPSKIYNSKLFVLSSKYEGMPNALMEAMALGIPSISTDCPCGGPKRLIKNNYNGILVKNNSIKSLETAMIKLIENEKLSQKIAKNACDNMKNFSEEKIVKRWENYIKRVIRCKNESKKK